MISIIFGKEDGQAASIASIAQFLPIFTAPVQGLVHDRFGHRKHALILAAFIFSVSTLILTPHLYSYFPPWTSMLLFSISLTLGPVALVSSIPIVLPAEFVGTGLGFYKSAMNVGITFFDILVGRLQDRSHGKYEAVLWLWFAMSIATSVAALIGLPNLDCKIKNQSSGIDAVEDDIEMRKRRRVGWTGILAFTVVTLVSWIMFFVSL